MLSRPLWVFASAKFSGGAVLLAAALGALWLANSPWQAVYSHWLAFKIGFAFGNHTLSHSVHFWINDALMAVFFLLVGLEIKREILTGELSDPRAAALPIAAALGGVLFPAVIYSVPNYGGPGAHGWGIPMATDIAFVAGALALLGKRVPTALAVFLTALAIVDDIFAVLVIALFYTRSINGTALAGAGLILLLLIAMNFLGVTHPAAYMLPGVVLWACVLQSGVHSTISGVILAAVIPGRRFLDRREFLRRQAGLLIEFESALEDDEARESAVEQMEDACRHVQSPLHRLEQGLRPWVSLAVMPIFAFANAGLPLQLGVHAFESAVALGVALGLIFGKPAGILIFSWASIRMGWASQPASVTWRHLNGAAWLAGIGFTMSLFVGHLAFGAGTLLDEAKLGIFGASVVAGITGSVLLIRARSARASASA